MATIGTFTKTGESFSGAVKTLSINAKSTIKPAEKASDKAPDYRIFQGSVDLDRSEPSHRGSLLAMTIINRG